MPKVTEAHVQARRKQIIDAATACFAQKGYHSSTIQDICKEADLSPGAIYGYFKGKYEILQAVIETTTQDIDEIIEALDNSGDMLTAFRAVAQVTFARLDDPEYQLRMRTTVVFHAEALRDKRVADAFASEVRYLLAGLKRFVTRAQKRGELDPAMEPEQVARMLFTVFEGYKAQKVIEPDIDTMAYVANLIPMLVRGLSPDK